MEQGIFGMSWGKTGRSGYVNQEKNKFTVICYEGSKKVYFGMFSNFLDAKKKVVEYVEKVDKNSKSE
jgi:hypothetical protein